MDRKQLLEILNSIASGEISPDEGLSDLADFPSARMEYAHLDTHRHIRRGIPETVFGQGKTPEQIIGIVERLSGNGDPVLVTRISDEAATLVMNRWSEADHDPQSRTLMLGSLAPTGGSPILVIAAGTSDLPVAQEAVRTAGFLGRKVLCAYDVGVAGLHRLTSYSDEMGEAGVIIAVAGMEGALPSVVAGHVACPVIAVPTSVGYGANFGGVAALLSMLNSCAANVCVVNIDAGFKGAYVAGLIASRRETR